MNTTIPIDMVIDDLAAKAGCYVSFPTKDDEASLELLFDICKQFKINYFSCTKKERTFVDEVTRVTWAKNAEQKTGVHLDIKPSFV